MVKRSVIAASLAAASILSYSAQPPAWKGKTEVKDGITIVHNPEAPLYPASRLVLEEELSLGEKNVGSDPGLVRPWSVKADGEGNMYVMDAGDACIKVFDGKGRFVGRIGRKGQGPGELQNPNSVHLLDGGRVVFEDFIRALTTFTKDGRFLGVLSTAKALLLDIAMTPDGRIVALANAIRDGQAGKELRLYDGGLNLVRVLLFLPDPPIDPQTLSPFSPGFHMAVDREGRVVAAFKEGYEIEVLRLDGKPGLRLTHPRQGVKIGSDEIAQAAKSARGRKLNVPARHAAVQGLWTDDRGRIYAATFERDESKASMLYDVFERDGRYLTRLAVPEGVRPRDWKGDKMYAVAEDAEGLPEIKRYAVRGGIPGPRP